MSATVSTNENDIKKVREVTNAEVFGYGFGGLANNLLSMMVNTYAIFFMTEIGGVTAGLAGTIFLVAKISDALFDPIIGTLSDKTVSPWGRYRPFMMFGSIFAAITFFLLFSTFEMSNTAKMVYYLVVYCLWSIGFTMTVMPYQSVVSIITDNKKKRNLLITVGKLLSLPAGIMVAKTLVYVDKLGGGASGWRKYITIQSIMIVLSMWICAFAIRRFDTREKAINANAGTNNRKFSFKDTINTIKSNKALLLLILGYATQAFAAAINTNAQTYYAKYVLEDTGFISSVGTIITALMIPIFVLAPILVKKFKKKDIFMVGVLMNLAFPISLLLVNPVNNYNVLVMAAVFGKVGQLLANVMSFMMLPDCVDYGYERTGIMSAGLITSSFTFFNKFADALGGFLVGAVLQLVGYSAEIAPTPLVLTTIVGVMVVPNLLMGLISFISIRKYPINTID